MNTAPKLSTIISRMKLMAGIGIPVKPECISAWAEELEQLALAPPSGEGVDVSEDDVWEAHNAYTDVYDGHGSERPAMRAALEVFAKSRQQPIAPDKPNFDEAVERLAKFIYRKESLNCKTIDEAMHHQSNWRRAIPEAREMLEAAIGSNLCAFFDIGGNSK